MASQNKLDLSALDYPRHPGGRRHLELAREHARADLLYLSNHLGRDHRLIEAVARTRGVQVPSGLRTELYDQLNDVAARLRRQHRGHVLVYRAYCVLVTLGLPAAWVWYLLSLSSASALLFGFLLVTYSFNVFHMRHHLGGRLYSAGGPRRTGWPARLDRWTGPWYRFIDETFSVSPAAWTQQHQASHHIFTNHGGRDYDVRKPYPVLRLHPQQPWRRYHAWQHFYVPLVLAVNGLSFALDNYWQKGGRLIWFVIHYSLLLVLPALFHGLGAAFLTYLLTVATASLLISYLFQVSHNATSAMRCAETEQPLQVDYDGWTRQQVEESVSYGGYLTTLLFGGINLQTEHHVAPAMEPLLLYFFQRDLRRICIARGFGYRRLSGLPAAIVEYHQRLALLGQPPKAGTVEASLR